VSSPITFAPERHSFQTDDARLRPIAEKVLENQRLDFNDGVAIGRAIFWL
jgi:aminodeoxyfutalosine synthase